MSAGSLGDRLKDRLREKAAGAATPKPPQLTQDKSVLLDFLQKVLPSQGNCCLFLLTSKKHEWFDSIADMAKRICELHDRTDVYFGVASFIDTDRRTQDNVRELRCFRLDLDAGDKKLAKHGPDKIYTTQDVALADLERFGTATGLYPSIVVSSGEGLHVYYCLEEAITRDQWQPLADELKKLCADHGLKADVAVTAESARILRPPGSLHTNGKRVKILKDTGGVFTYDEFAKALGYVAGSVANAGTGINADVRDDYDDTPADFDKIKAECEAVRWAVENPEQVEEPYWRATLGIVKFCDNPRDLAHVISKGHPGYKPDVTDAKLRGWGAKPTTCEHFASFNPDACQRCQYREGSK